MSLFSALRAGRSSSVASSFAIQSRGYATPAKPAKKVASKFRPNAKNERKKPATRDTGLFRPMPANSLTHPLFQSEQRIPLNLPVFRPEILTPEVVNTVMAFPTDSQSTSLKAYGLPKNVLVDYMVLSRPCSVVRSVTVGLLDQVDQAAHTSSAATRLVFTGKGGCGKSYILLQAVQYCTQQNWITLYIPRAISLVNSSSSYAYDPRTQTYGQPFTAQQLLKRFVDVNKALIEGIRVQTTYPFEERSIDGSSTLMDLINVGLEFQHQAPTVFTALMKELAQQTVHPVLLAIDDFQALYGLSSYRDPYFKQVKAHHLTLPRTLLEFASGKQTFARGVVLGALSTSNSTWRAPLELVEALGIIPAVSANPYVPRQPELVDYAKGLRSYAVPDELTVDEAASIFDVWQNTKALHLARGDETFLSKYTEAGGNAREFVQRSLLQTLAL